MLSSNHDELILCARDDPVEKHLPNVTYPSYGWSEYLNGMEHDVIDSRPHITLRQLASHLSGVFSSSP